MTARSPRPALRPILLIGVVLLALLAAAVVIAGLPLAGLSQGTPTPSPTAATPARTADAATEPAREPSDDTAWWRLRFDLMAMGDVQVFDIGTLGDGVVSTVEVAMQVVDPDALVFPMRSIIGPAGGRVVTIGADGPETVLTSIDAASGEQSEVVRTTHVVIDAQFLNGTSILFLTADRATGQLTGSWLVDAAAPAAPEPVEGLLARQTDFQLVARQTDFTRLFVSATGDVAAVHHCGLGDVCELRVVNLVDGTRSEHQIRAGDEPIGIAQGVVFLRPMCMDMTCSGEVLDLETGERTPLPDTGNRRIFGEAVIAAQEGPALITQLTGSTVPMEGAAEGPSFVVTDLDDGATGPPVPVPLGSMRIISLPGSELGVELPPGWFLALGGEPIAAGEGAATPMTAFAVEAATGRLVPLPALGEFFIQG